MMEVERVLGSFDMNSILTLHLINREYFIVFISHESFKSHTLNGLFRFHVCDLIHLDNDSPGLRIAAASGQEVVWCLLFLILIT
jgi:hypothetical protein